MSFYPPLDAADPHVFIAGIVAVFSKYPGELMDAAAAPDGIPMRLKTLRSLADIEEVCRELYEPIARRLTREAIERQPRMLPPPERSAEEQAKIDAQVSAWRKSVGLKDA